MLDIAACAGVNELPSQGEISPSIRGSFFDPRTQATATVITTRMLPLSLDRAVSIPGSDFHHGLLTPAAGVLTSHPADASSLAVRSTDH